jgi:hypothetical protein
MSEGQVTSLRCRVYSASMFPRIAFWSRLSRSLCDRPHSSTILDTMVRITPSRYAGLITFSQADACPVDFIDPNLAGGGMLNRAGSGGGEPLNVSQSIL